MAKRPLRVKEPVQVYLDDRDRSLLEELAEKSSLSRAELLRMGLRRLSHDLLGEQRAGGSLDLLIGVLDDAPDVPKDLAARHDEYLYGEPRPATRPRRRG
jgi:hypothetical protein